MFLRSIDYKYLDLPIASEVEIIVTHLSFVVISLLMHVLSLSKNCVRKELHINVELTFLLSIFQKLDVNKKCALLGWK